MTKNEAMQMALDVLTNKRYAPSIKETIEALQEALAQPEVDSVLIEREKCAKRLENDGWKVGAALIRARGKNE